MCEPFCSEAPPEELICSVRTHGRQKAPRIKKRKRRERKGREQRKTGKKDGKDVVEKFAFEQACE